MNSILRSTIIILISCTSIMSYAQSSVDLLGLRVDATFHNISVHQTISGDDNLNSTMTIEYRPAGTTTYLPGALTMRAHPGLVIDGDPFTMNFHAGSIMGLQPGTSYDIRIQLTDPDGGGAAINTQASTKVIPVSNALVTKYVAPGNGGGTGTSINPYLGLQAAADDAEPGDLFIVAAGTYAPFQLLESGTDATPITFISEQRHMAIIDGGNTSRGVVTIGEFDTTVGHVIIDGFIIRNGRWGVDAQRTQYVTVRNNIIEDVDYGYVNRRDGGIERDQTITNNRVTGRTSWPLTGIPQERGIDIRGNNNVVSHNTISLFGDGISTDGQPYLVSYSLDIHDNDIRDIVDDIIEVDGMISNTRIYRNRGFNGRAGVSVAPVYGGPCYIIRNELFNLGISAFKMNRGPSGIIVAHNTVSNITNAISSSAGWQNTIFRNNIVFADRYCFEEFDLVPGSRDDWDYSAYYSNRSGQAGSEWFKWDNVRYANVAVIQGSGVLEANSIEVGFNDFENIALPVNNNTSYNPTDRDFMPKPSAPVVNTAEPMDNINYNYVLDDMPDRGALERGMPRPIYGAVFSTSSCTDGIKNGNEDYVDCGGNLCTPCHKCPYAMAVVSDRPLQSILALRTTTSISSSALLTSDATITLEAGSFLDFLPTFEVPAGGLLTADINTCN